MGYCMQLKDSVFRIKNENKLKALSLLKQLANKNDYFSWVNLKKVSEKNTLVEAMKECRWELTEHENGDIIGISFAGEKLGDDYVIFRTIAPAVEDCSFIEMVGDDGGRWKWVFRDGECSEHEGIIDYVPHSDPGYIAENIADQIKVYLKADKEEVPIPKDVLQIWLSELEEI